MKYLFYSDSAQAQFGADAKQRGYTVDVDGYGIEVMEDGPAVEALALAHGGYPEAPETPNSSIGVEANNDIGAFSTRSSARNMPGYEPPAVETIIPKPFASTTPRRATRGQPL